MSSEGRGGTAPTYAAVLRAPHYLPIFVANALSLWGDYIARVTVAAVVYERTRSPLATATTLAVSLLPTFFGRSLVGPVVDRFPYKWVLIWSHLLRALCVLGLIGFVDDPLARSGRSSSCSSRSRRSAAPRRPPTWCCSPTSSRTATSTRVPSASARCPSSSTRRSAWPSVAASSPCSGRAPVWSSTSLTFLVAAAVIFVVVELRPVTGPRGKGLRGFVARPDLGRARPRPAPGARAPRGAERRRRARHRRPRGARPSPSPTQNGWGGWGGVLMAAPIVGAFVGIILIGRLHVQTQNRLIVPLALAHAAAAAGRRAAPADRRRRRASSSSSGLLQAFMVPLQATFTLVTEPEMRGRIFSLAGLGVGGRRRRLVPRGRLARPAHQPLSRRRHLRGHRARARRRCSP